MTRSGRARAEQYRIVLSVDWEGDPTYQDDDNLGALRDFRRAHPRHPLLHFVNAAPFVARADGPSADTAGIRRRLASVLRPGDEVGLHLHGWKSVVEAAGVTWRSAPRFNGEGGPIYVSAGGDMGYEVIVSCYDRAELLAVLETCKAVFLQNGLPMPRSYRAGGWMSGEPHVYEALIDAGFLLDSSAVAVDLVIRSTKGAVVTGTVHAERLLRYWGGPGDGSGLGCAITPAAQPYRIVTPSGRAILQLPDNGVLADYVTGDQMLQVFRDNVVFWSGSGKRVVFLHFGLHAETARRHIADLADGLAKIAAHARQIGAVAGPARLPLHRQPRRFSDAGPYALAPADRPAAGELRPTPAAAASLRAPGWGGA